MNVRDGLCGICPAGCWVRIHLEGGRLARVEPLEDHPLGMICEIGRHSPEVVYDPNRLRTPLRRVGPKPGYTFEPISWDAALDEIADKLRAIKEADGAEATAIYTGRGSFDMALCDLFQPDGVAVSSASSVLFPFGSPNTLGVGALCYVSFAMIAPHVTMGEMLITMDTDIDSAELIVLWGANPATDSPPITHHQILRARRRGAAVVSIDPRRMETARRTEAEWVPVRPGTDGALALSMIQVLIEEELYDDLFVADWTVGFDSLVGLAQHYRPEIVEEIAGVSADTIRSLARRIASARGACPVIYSGLEYSDSGVQAIRAVHVLWALAGQLDVPGGLQFRMKENLFPQNRTRLVANPDMSKALGRDRFPVYSLYRGESHAIALPEAVCEGNPYPIRALLILGGSILTSWPDPALWRRTLDRLEFLVTIDRYHTADSAYADIVLPATTQYETTSYMRYGPMFKIRERVIDPVGESRNDFLILADLAGRLGYGDAYPQSEEEILRFALEGSGYTLEEVRSKGGSVQIPTVMMEYKKWEKGRLRPDGKAGFNTPTGKFEISSTVLAEHGYDPLPVYTEPREGPLSRPDLAERFPLVFNSGARTRFDFRSQHHGVEGLSAKHPEPLVHMNRSDASARGIADGDAVWVATPRGRTKFRARVSVEIVAGAVDANMGGGGPLGPDSWRQCNVNCLTDLDHYDPISGFPVYKTLLCEVTPAAGSPRASTSGSEDEPIEVEPVEPEPSRRIYLDHNATTACDPRVLEEMMPFLRDDFGNPSSIYGLGGSARSAVADARRKVALALGCTARRLVFTGGGSEANNLALQGVLAAARQDRRHLVTCAIEHPAVLATCRALERSGVALTILPVDAEGRVDPEAVERAIRPETMMVSVMLANNEIGTIQPIARIAEICRSRGVLCHTDAVQALGKIAFDVGSLGVDLLSVSAHKVHGPKGIGALYVHKGVDLQSLIHGGGQEHGLRAGTENVPGIVGFGRACEIAMQDLGQGAMQRTRELRDLLELGIGEVVPGARRNGPRRDRLPNTLCIFLPGIRGESFVLFLDRRGIFFSSGSACKSGDPDPSHVLLAIGLSREEAHCSIRLSLGAGNTRQETETVLAEMSRTVRDTFRSIRFVPCR